MITRIRVEDVGYGARCRGFNAQGRPCGSLTRYVVVIAQQGREDLRSAYCSRHSGTVAQHIEEQKAGSA